MSPIQSQASNDPSGAQPARILVVEDERIVARDLASALTELGYCVPETVATGEDAISRVRDLRPDLVLMDIRLPGTVDGIRAAASVRDELNIPVIFLSAHSDDETLRRAMQTGPVGYLVKPFSAPQLRCAVEIALNRNEINARLREREQWLAATLRSVGDAVAGDCGAGGRDGAAAASDALALERKVAERIADLEAANRELESFTYGVAHDLRGPLRGIDGLSQSLIEDYAANLGAEGLKRLRQVRETAGRMRQVIDNLLLLSIDDLLVLSGVRKTEPCRNAIDLSQIAMDVMERLRQATPERAVKAVIERGVWVDGDGALLRIALENLLSNAWKYTGEVEHPRIEFGAIDREGSRIFFVRDNGAGFDTSQVNRLFGAFEEIDTAAPFECQGLGLAVVQRVIDKHGGRIWAEGAVGRGATFYFAI